MTGTFVSSESVRVFEKIGTFQCLQKQQFPGKIRVIKLYEKDTTAIVEQVIRIPPKKSLNKFRLQQNRTIIFLQKVTK